VSQVIAVAGKGGTGKTTVASLLIRGLSQESGPILAVDADPNSNLPVTLGLEPEETIGGVLEEFHGSKLKIPQGISKQAYLEMRLHQAVVESKGMDFLVMGRQEGPGCYCSANAVLRDFLEKLSENYLWVVVDNEAGMEHLSRRTESRINVLILVSDPTVKGIRTVKNLVDLVDELKLEIDHKYLVVNRAESLDKRLNPLVESLSIPFLGCIPDDPLLMEADLEEGPLLKLPEDSPAVRAVDEILAEIKQGKKSSSLKENNQIAAERG
jgi:CO dehydrogenase maturation factor